MPIIELEHAVLNYRMDGPETAPVVLLSNSLGTNLSMWDSQVAALTSRFRVLRYDTRGHGGSTATGKTFTISMLGNDAVNLLQRLGIDQVHVCGVSLGGMTALWMAIHAPELVRSVMACTTAARIGTFASWEARIRQVEQGGLASIADATMTRWFTESFRQRSSAVVGVMHESLRRTDDRGYMACCSALQQADLRDEIASVVAPTLVVSGTHDEVTPPADGVYLQKHIPGALYRQVDGSHLSNIEAASEFNEAMLDFLAAQ